MLRILLLLLALFLAAPRAAPAQEPPKPACEVCKDRGLVPCRLCASRVCESERGFLFCSAACECGDCGGVRWRRCGACAHAPELDMAARRAELAAWRETTRPLEEYMSNRGLVQLESQHFLLASDVKRTDAKRAGSQHAAAHWLLDQLEGQFADFCAEVGCAEEDFTGKTTVLLWIKDSDQERASSKYTLERSTTQAKLMGDKPVISLCFGKGRLRTDEDLRHALAHQTAHCLLSSAYEGLALLNQKSGWIDEGLAHWYELKYFGEALEWCSIEQKAVADAKLGRFEALVLDALAHDAAPGLSSVAGQDLVQLTPQQRVFGWSYVDALMRRYPGRLGALAKQLKRKKLVGEAVQDALGVPQAEFEAAWHDFAKSTYSARPARK